MFEIRKYIKVILFTCGILLSVPAWAVEIPAVDFSGNIIGQVISTGLVINGNGENIGSITADSLIVDNNGNVIGGVVPQGIAIGNDNRFLGKVHGDGVVRSVGGKDLGKALPNGLIIDSQAEIIGAVLFPGLVYSPEGKTVGRMTGAGAYTNLDGKEIGFISANGYAYHQSGEDYVFDGKLTSSKMVVSIEGKFIGSLAPTGAVVDFEGKEIGVIHANTFAYDKQGQIIGRLVYTAYAFDLSGQYVGIVTYNGEVVKNGRVIGYYRADGNIIDTKGNVVGFAVDIASLANDNKGHYLGMLVPGGNIVRGDAVVGRVGARGYVYSENKKIGEIFQTGPVYDTLGHLRGQIVKNGTVISLSGAPIGQAHGRYAFDTTGTLLGGTSNGLIAIDNTNRPLGMANADSQVKLGSEKEVVSPFGYLFNKAGKISGRAFVPYGVYGVEGLLYSYLTPNGNLYFAGQNNKMTSQGILLNNKGYVGGIVNPLYTLGFNGQSLGIESQTNILVNDKGAISYKLLPGGYVAESEKSITKNMAPIKGFSSDKMIALNTGGDLIGYADNEANVTDLSGNNYGRVIYGDYVLDNNNNVTGRLIPFATVSNEKCAMIGVVNGRGDVINNREVIIGHLLPNGQAISDVGSYVGYAVFAQGLIDFDNHYVGTIVDSHGVDLEGKSLGCVNRKGQILDDSKKVLYGVIESYPVIDFENKIVGHIMANGSVVDNKSKIIGYVQPNGNVVSKSKKNIGQAMKYRIAYNNDNHFIGMVQDSGEVKNSQGEVIGQVLFDGSVQKDDEVVGYALYDFYVYDDNFTTYGYLTKDGVVLSAVGSRLGSMDRGFVLDKTGKVIARGNRDYIVRDASYNSVGELKIDGTVVDFEGQNVGYLSDAGVIRNSTGDEIAQATPLQYYVPREAKIKEPQTDNKEQDWVDNRKVQITDIGSDGKPTTPEQPQITGGGQQSNMGNRVVGIALNPDGDVIGNIYDDDSVRADDGTQVGFRTPDGIIVDMNYNPIGVEEVHHVSADNMFVPADAFGSGNPYGIGSQPSNLGPGGGYGQGERYDPIRAQALKRVQDARRQGMAVGKIESNIKVSSFTGYEEDGWPGAKRNISTWRVDMSTMILEDKAIPAVLARSVYASEGFSDNIPITAIVERNIYAEEGRNVIIPAGSRVIGKLAGDSGSGGNSGGAVKVGITWTRLLRPDGSQFNIGGSQTADAQGRAGAIGYLDEQLMKKYSMPLLYSALESTTAYLMASGKGSSSSSSGTTTEDARSQAAEDARQNFITQMDKIFEDLLKKKANIRSVIYIPAGTRIIIFPQQDLWLNSEELEKKKGKNGDENGGSSEGGLTSYQPSGSGGGQSVTYEGDVQENVNPVQGGSGSGGLTSSDQGQGGNGGYGPGGSYGGGGYPPPSMGTTSGGAEDDVPDLL